MIKLSIDNVDPKVYGFKFLRKEMKLPIFETFGQEWIKESFEPMIGEQKRRYTPIICYFIFSGDENNYETMKSVFIEKILRCTLKFSDSDYYYKCIFDSESKIEKIGPYNIEIGINFNIYSKIKQEVTETMNRITSKTINVSGNLETPVILEVTSSIDLIDLTINGLDEEAIILKNLKANKKLIVNGEEGTVTVDGINKYGDTDMWGFPRLKPGANTITVSKNNVDITIKYKPRYI